MIDIEKQIAFWKQGAEEEWEFAQETVERGKTRQGLFWTHLAFEKALKALVCRKTTDYAPKIHNLVKLADLAGLALSIEELDLLSDLNSFQLEGRYAESYAALPTLAEAKIIMERSKKAFQWLMNQLQT
jgi:HEPN domain-containing protein